MLHTTDLEEIRSYVERLVIEAGSIIVGTNLASLSIQTKKNATDVVTSLDREIETLLCQRLKSKYPAYAFMGEETYKTGTEITEQGTFIVDPIDGTGNFVHGHWEVCVSIGFTFEKEPVVGVVYNPFRSELWSGVKGCGAFLQVGLEGEKQSLPLNSPLPPLNGVASACIGLEWSSDRDGPNFDLNLHVVTTLARSEATGGRFVHALRFTGSAAQSICRVAAGQQDAFWQCGCWAWDVAAAWCILIEAGGVMVDGHPHNWNPPVDNRRYLAIRPASPYEQRDFAKQYWSALGDRRSSYGPKTTPARPVHSSTPGGVPIKFSPQGIPAVYEGNTTVCHVPTDSAILPSLRAVYTALRKHPTLSQRMFLVPPDSWHVTILGGVRERLREPGQWPLGKESMPLEECNKLYASRLRTLGQQLNADGLAPPYKVRLSGFDADNGVGIGVNVVGETAEEDRRLRRLRDRISDEAFGFRTKDHDTFLFHVTISYFLKHIEGTERLALDKILASLLSVTQGYFELGAVEFCTFVDMLHYERMFYLGD